MEIGCYIDLFELHKRIYLINSEEESKCISLAFIENIDEVISAMCRKYQCYKVHLYGNIDYINKIAEQIIEYSAKKYQRNNIEILLN